MKNTDRMGVYILSSHLIITLAIIILYGVTLFMGVADSTLQMLIIAAVSFWFGSVGKDTLRPPGTQITHANEVKVSPEQSTKEGDK